MFFSSCSSLNCILMLKEDGDIFWMNDVCEIRIQTFFILSLLWQHTVDISSVSKKAISVSFSSTFCKMSKQHWIRARVRLMTGFQPAFWMGIQWGFASSCKNWNGRKWFSDHLGSTALPENLLLICCPGMIRMEYKCIPDFSFSRRVVRKTEI